MKQIAAISISQEPDVFAFVSKEIGRGSSIGAIYHQLPAAEQAIDDMTTALARHVLEMQPANARAAPRDKWLQAAYALIKEDRPPLPRGYSMETQVNRLIRLVDGKCQRVMIGFVPELDSSKLRDAHLIAEWIQRTSDLPTSIVHGAGVAAPGKRGALRSSFERKLAARLEQDSELQGLFEPNVLLLTVFQTRPRVDFLWRAGRLIIEIDSFAYHSHRDEFTGDRQRDYETLVSGYVTVRVTDQEVTSDLDLVVQKIRRCVRIRRNLFHV